MYSYTSKLYMLVAIEIQTASILQFLAGTCEESTYVFLAVGAVLTAVLT